MNLYFLCHTPLGDVDRLDVPPKTGDVVCFVRRAQDPTGGAWSALAEQAIDVIDFEDIVTPEMTAAADALGDRFLKTWFMDGGRDFSDLGNLSLGTSYGYVLALQIRPRSLLRTAAGFKKLSMMYPLAGRFFSDAQNGMGIFETARGVCPLAGIIVHVSAHLGREIRFLPPINAVPSAFSLGPRNGFWNILKISLGRFRPSWIRAYFAFKKRRRKSPDRLIFYMFLGRAHEYIAEKIAKRTDIHVVCSQLGIPGADSLRCDHILALPSWRDMKIVRKLLATINGFSRRPSATGRFMMDGINYDKVLFGTVAEVLKIQIWAFLIVVAQARKFQKVVGPFALLINEACNEPMGNLVMLNRHTDLKIYLIPHGMNQSRYTFLTPAIDNPHVTYLAFGSDNQNFYHSGNEQSRVTRQELTGNPLTTHMNELRLTRSQQHEKRLLVLNYCFSDLWSSARGHAGDRYYIEIFEVLKKLIGEGWTVSFRPHPYHHHNFESWLADHFELNDAITWDYSPSLGDALKAHDVVVSNMSSALYQSLFAGWPTIFYEPDYLDSGSIEGLENDPMYTGLQTAKDLQRPVTNDPATLAKMIRDSLNPDSMVSTFPKRFAGELAPRFIGPHPANADKVIADFLEHDFGASRANLA